MINFRWAKVILTNFKLLKEYLANYENNDFGIYHPFLFDVHAY